MINVTDKTNSDAVVLERRFDATPEEMWELWTTKDGFESWWGPKGFRVEVLEMEAHLGGRLSYSMIAVGADEIAFMEKSGQPTSHATTGTFSHFEPHTSLALTHLIDFMPGVEAYEHVMNVHFVSEGETTLMVIHIAPHSTAEITRMATMGMESQLTKLPEVLAARR